MMPMGGGAGAKGFQQMMGLMMMAGGFGGLGGMMGGKRTIR